MQYSAYILKAANDCMVVLEIGIIKKQKTKKQQQPKPTTKKKKQKQKTKHKKRMFISTLFAALLKNHNCRDSIVPVSLSESLV